MVRRPSTIDKLPQEIRELIGRLRESGSSIDQILGKLQELDAEVSRSALGRHVKTLAEVGERMRGARAMAEALTARFGDQPDDRVSRLNFQLMHGIVFETLVAAPSSDQIELDAEGKPVEGQPLTLDPKQVKFLSGALKDLASAQKLDADRILRIEADARLRAASAGGKEAKAMGLSEEQVRKIEHAILGVET
jgi:hypothetical protein